MSKTVPQGVSLRPAGTLTNKALACLAQRPMSTAAIAEEVLALRGNPRVAAAAVFALLATDKRVRVDACGIWSLVSAEPATQPISLGSGEWVVVDVETTGCSPRFGDRIIEFAAVRVANGRITEQYTTLVNPLRSIPFMITSLTGITEAEVADSPRFEEIAPEVIEAVKGRVFVGHNVGFDWRFVCSEVERCTGNTLVGRQLCTLRLARRFLPQLPSRSLGALAHYFGVEMVTCHRALDDAMATAKLLIHFLDLLQDRGVSDWDGLQGFLRIHPKRRRPRRYAMPRSMETP
jgi:DNA polymerase III epsilon subunit family exonuclease